IQACWCSDRLTPVHCRQSSLGRRNGILSKIAASLRLQNNSLCFLTVTDYRLLWMHRWTVHQGAALFFPTLFPLLIEDVINPLNDITDRWKHVWLLPGINGQF